MVEHGDAHNETEWDISQTIFREYIANPHNPEAITQIWRAFLPEVNIPNCNWTEEKIVEPIIGVDGNDQKGMLIFLPEIYKGAAGLVSLGKKFPAMNSWCTSEGNEKGLYSYDVPAGWYKIEADLNAPNLGVSVEQASAHFSLTGKFGQALEAFILGSQFSMVTRGHNFDEYLSSILPGTRIDQRPASALFFPSGNLSVIAALPTRRVFSQEGVRSMQLH